MTLWQLEKEEFKLLKRWNLQRRANKVIFGRSSDEILIADKSGDVYAFTSAEEEGKLLLGHLSMLLDVLIADKFILTCDRDEKIRVSNFPKAYNINNFCLGHSDFVTCMQLLPAHPVKLLSSSGDGSIKVWDFLVGRELSSRLCYEDAGMNKISEEAMEEETDENQENEFRSKKRSTPAVKIMKVSSSNLIAAVIEGLKGVLLYKYNEASSKLVFLQLLRVASHVWDVAWDDLGQLWVMERHSSYLSTFGPSEDGTFHPLGDTTFNTNTADVKQFFEASELCSQSLDELYKRWYDNMKEYLHRKEGRLAAKGKKAKIDEC